MLPIVNRRSLLLASVAGAAATALHATSAQAGARSEFAYVGSRTTKARNARGTGITVWRVNGPRPWEQIQTLPADDGDPGTPGMPGELPINPSFLTLSADGRFLYAVHGDATQVSSFARNTRTGLLTVLNTVDTGRRNPVHLAIDPTGRWLAVAHLAPPGSVTTLPITATGALGQTTSALELPGSPGPHKTQQLGPNPHHVVFDPSGHWLLIPDRGLDRIFTAKLDPGSGALALHDPGWTPTRELEGPRHLAFHPERPFAYVVNELRSTVTTYRWDRAAGELQALEVLPCNPPSATGDSRGAEIVVAPSGQYIYVSNRSGAGDSTPGGPGPDTIGVFRIDSRSGTLTPVRWVPTEGIRPRFIGLNATKQRLFAANEVTDTIAGFSLHDRGGRLEPHGVVAHTGSPVCIVFQPAGR
ncbi:6-phosphogluconolactonase [Actinoplanes sp. ATCC 53533]|uniref:lactonase family protein n=1 Tax=Actinoplanes sp. ATCC 53533 TaxID=1288362 RepID=UPI000F77B01F|nr:lactonase family protein [Actinoplanes sp. ATCC 53533]RSM68241.1 6-phosphogluconolactonase [Actinoplanes sp. ATCC 53533]